MMNEGVSWGLFVFIDQFHFWRIASTNACYTPFRVGVGSCPSGRGLTSMSTMSEHSDLTTKGFRQLLYLTGSWY